MLKLKSCLVLNSFRVMELISWPFLGENLRPGWLVKWFRRGFITTGCLKKLISCMEVWINLCLYLQYFHFLLNTWTIPEVNRSADSFLRMECPNFPTETHVQPGPCCLLWIWQETDGMLSSKKNLCNIGIATFLGLEFNRKWKGVQHEAEMFGQ